MNAIRTDQNSSLKWNEQTPYSSRKRETWTSGSPAIASPPQDFFVAGAYGSRRPMESGIRAQRWASARQFSSNGLPAFSRSARTIDIGRLIAVGAIANRQSRSHPRDR